MVTIQLAPPKPGQGSQPNPLSVQELLLAAPKGDAEAQYTLGRAYQDGFGVKQDIAEAATWYQRAAEQGHLECAKQSGNAVRGYRQDYAGAAQWFGRAATDGNADAQYNLGVLCHKGLGVGRNDEVAVQWFQKSAAQGHVEAKRSSAKCIESGQGVKQDNIEAYNWLKLAQLQGDEEVKDELKACAASMSREQIAAAEKQVQEIRASGEIDSEYLKVARLHRGLRE